MWEAVKALFHQQLQDNCKHYTVCANAAACTLRQLDQVNFTAIECGHYQSQQGSTGQALCDAVVAYQPLPAS